MRLPNIEQASDKEKEKSYRTILDTTNFIVVILNTALIILLGPTLFNLFGVIVSGVLFYVSKRNIPETIVFLLVYPLGWLILLNTEREEIEDFFNVDLPSDTDLKIDSSALSSLPIKTLLTIGNTREKKIAAQNIYRYVTHGIEIEQNMKYLNRLLDDSHMDVALYASQSFEDIESYFEKRIGRLRHKNTLDLCIAIYYYLRTGIAKAKIKEDFELFLREKISNINSTHPLYYEIMYYVTKDESYLLDSYIKNRDTKAMKRYIFEKLKNREFGEIKKFSKQEILSLVLKDNTSNNTSNG